MMEILDYLFMYVLDYSKKSTNNKMEEKSIIDNSSFDGSVSEWKIRHNMYQTSRNFRQLENRLHILQLEKQKKLKQIENKLNTHKKFVENKIYKYNHKSTISGFQNDSIKRCNSNSRMFQAQRDSRSLNIKMKKDNMRETKHKLFAAVKKQSQANEQRIKKQNLQNQKKNQVKRNKVRIMEIGCKENIENYWNTRLEDMQQNRKFQMMRRLKQHEDNLKRLEKLQFNQESLLQEIKRTEQVESQLSNLITQEKSMDGQKLGSVYLSKVSNA